MNTLIPREPIAGDRPIDIERTADRRHRPHVSCFVKPRGWLWFFGYAWNGYLWLIDWRCDRCSQAYTEFVEDMPR